MAESKNSFRSFLADFIRKEAQPVDKFGHQPRLYRLACEIGAGLAYDDDVVYAAAWLHDLGVFLGHRPQDPAELARWDNVRYAAENAPGILRGSGFPESKVVAVVDAIRQHLPDGRPTKIEGELLHDADVLEQLGSIGILRIIAKVGRDTRYSTFSQAARTLRRNLDNLPGKIILPAARNLARPRIDLLNRFLEELDREALGDLN